MYNMVATAVDGAVGWCRQAVGTPERSVEEPPSDWLLQLELGAVYEHRFTCLCR